MMRILFSSRQFRSVFFHCRLWMLFVLFVGMSAVAAAASPEEPVATSVTVHAVKGFQQEYSLKVAAVIKDKVMSVDMGSLARALRLIHKREGDHLVIENTLDGKRSLCHLYEKNNFVRIDASDPSEETRVIQLQSPPVLRGEALYLPVADAARMFALWLDREVYYDSKSGRIDAFLWSSRPGSEVGSIGVVKPQDRDIRAGNAARHTGLTELTAMNINELVNGVVIRIKATGAESVASFIKPDASGMAYLTFKNAKGDPSMFLRSFSKGLLKEIKAIPLGGGAMQLSMSFNNTLFNLKSTQHHWDARTNTYIISVLTDVDVQQAYRQEKLKSIQQGLLHDQQKWKFDSIVLDAGHGGRDPGAVGPGGTQEKDVVLNIVKELGQILQKEWPDVKVIYTRTDDRLIALKQRGKIANQNDAKLFVSVHCNAAKNRKAEGAEVYILGPHKNDAALEVAMLENAAIKQEEGYEEKYKGVSEEHMILSSLAQSAFTLQSTTVARHVLEGMEQKTSINGRGVRQAGFMVLWTPSMPSVLVEAGYLSNPKEEKLLRQAGVQRDIARGIYNGLARYRQHYEQQQLASMGEPAGR